MQVDSAPQHRLVLLTRLWHILSSCYNLRTSATRMCDSVRHTCEQALNECRPMLEMPRTLDPAVVSLNKGGNARSTFVNRTRIPHMSTEASQNQSVICLFTVQLWYPHASHLAGDGLRKRLSLRTLFEGGYDCLIQCAHVKNLSENLAPCLAVFSAIETLPVIISAIALRKP
ncbi:hypothetical protein BC835DRAFT_1044642 [Cytidiella melzeri]|nr:hypothetical protein BC835DRAFT_1044642 [Cytidiella melzeri]